MRAVQVKQETKGKKAILEIVEDITKRKQAEELAATLIHSSQIGVYVVQDGTFEIINPQIMKVLGFNQDELLGENALNLVHPEDRAMVRENAIKMLKGKRLKPYEFRVCGKDGTTRLVMEVVAPITYKGKRAVLGNFMDITEHKRAEEALRESEETYKTLAEDAPIGIYFMDFRGTFLYGNKKAEEITGYKLKELLGKNFLKLKLLDPQEMGKAMKLLTLNKLGKTTGPDRFVLNRKDGTKSIVEIRTRITMVSGKKVVLGMVEDITERKQAEEALNLQRAHFQQLFDNSPDAMAWVDTADRFVDVNKGFETLFGYSAEEIRGRFINETLVPEDRIDEAAALSQARFSSKVVRKETVRKRKDGSLVDVSILGYPIRFGNEMVGAYVIYTDITERKQAEEALRESQKFSSSLLENSPNPITVVNLDTSIRYVNPAFEKLTGFSLAEIMDRKAPYPWWPEGKRTRILAAFKDAIKHGGRRTERNFQKKNGERFWVALNSAPVMQNGKAIYLIISWLDITERKRAEEALRESEERFRSIVENSQAGIMILDDTYRLTYVNDKLCRISGYSPKEVVGQDFRKFLDEESKQLVAERYIRRQRGEEVPPRYEFNIIKKDGQKRRVEISSAVIKDSAGKVKTVSQILDITERKQAEEELQAEKNKLKSVIDAMECGLTTQDADYNIIYQNELVRKLFGDRLGEKCYRVYEGQEKLCDGCPVKKTFKDGKSHTSERRVVLPSGEVTFWENTANPIRDAKGKIVSCLEVTRNITERKQAEEELQAEKNKLKSVINAMTDGLSIQDRDYNIIYQNEPSRIGAGHDCLGEKCYQAYENRDKVCDGCPVEKAFKDGKPHTAERTHVMPSGEVTFWENTANPIRDAKGKIISCLEVTRNITERKRAEEALADEATQRRILVEQSRDGIVVLDEKGKVYEANQRFADMLGYTPKEVRELHVWDWEAAFPRERVAEMIESVGPEGDHFETRHRRKDGTLYDVEISTNGAVIAGQKLIFCVCRDITERKQAEEALRESQEKLQKMFESVTDGILVIDLNGVITGVNQRMVEIHGFGSKDELLGKNALELVAPSDHERIANNMRQALKQGTISGVEYTLLRADGTEFPAELSTSVLKSASGNWAGHITIVRDVTERKGMEEQLMLTDRLASIGELASGIAHELNNPLTSIIGFSQLLMEGGNIADDAREDLKLVHSEAKRAADIVKNLLTFARKHAPVKQLTLVNNIIKDVLSLRAYEQKVNNIKVIKHFAPDLPEIMVDHFLMRQVFLNLIINAEYFMAESRSGGTLTITTKSSNDIVRVSFADDGPGIPRENLSRIFSPFFTTKEVGKGTGLGLSICHGIVAEHGGSIYARSQLGKGATFVIELPISSP